MTAQNIVRNDQAATLRQVSVRMQVVIVIDAGGLVEGVAESGDIGI